MSHTLGLFLPFSFLRFHVCPFSRFHVFTLRKLGERLATLPPGHRHTEGVFTFSRVEFWVNVSRLSPPAIDRPTEEPQV